MRYLLLAEGFSGDPHYGKTMRGVLRYRRDDVVAILDSTRAGEAEDGVPVVGSVEDALTLAPTTALVGVATQGGRFPPEWLAILRACVEHGLDVENGLHIFLADDPGLRALAEERGVELRDLRRPPADLSTATGENLAVDATIVLTVGSDCAIGKMTVSLELDLEARRRGLRSVFVPTGQTGMVIAGWGIAVGAGGGGGGGGGDRAAGGRSRSLRSGEARRRRARGRVIVAVVSDTHLPRGTRRIPDACLQRLRSADLILHAGDVTAAAVLDELAALGPPLHAVHGNMDDSTLRERLPGTLVVDVDTLRIGMTHDAGPRAGRAERLVARFPDCAAVVYGHTHEPQVARVGETWILNPGSPTERRRAPSHTMLVLELERETVRPELIALT